MERTWLSFHDAVSLTDRLELLAAIAAILKAEAEGFDDEGDGFALAGGLRYRVWQQDASALQAYGQFLYLEEDYGHIDNGSVRQDREATSSELTLGMLYLHEFAGQVTLFGGVELIPYSDGELEITIDNPVQRISEDLDAERDDIVGARMGLRAVLGSVIVQGEVALGHEESFRITLISRI